MTTRQRQLPRPLQSVRLRALHQLLQRFRPSRTFRLLALHHLWLSFRPLQAFRLSVRCHRWARPHHLRLPRLLSQERHRLLHLRPLPTCHP